jgi:fibrillarin-like rRNA methylase
VSSDSPSHRIHWQGTSIWTLNATKGKTVYGERLRKIKGDEYRKWDPTRSKIGAALKRSKSLEEYLIPQPGEEILYLGAGHGTTISHLHDVVCGHENSSHGRILALDHAPRCIRDLHHLANIRQGIVPVMADVRNTNSWNMMIPNGVRWMFQDVSQAGQAELFAKICHKFLHRGGLGILSLKSASERWFDKGRKAMVRDVENTLKTDDLAVLESLDLHGLQNHHQMFIVKKI